MQLYINTLSLLGKRYQQFNKIINNSYRIFFTNIGCVDMKVHEFVKTLHKVCKCLNKINGYSINNEIKLIKIPDGRLLIIHPRILVLNPQLVHNDIKEVISNVLNIIDIMNDSMDVNNIKSIVDTITYANDHGTGIKNDDTIQLYDSYEKFMKASNGLHESCYRVISKYYRSKDDLDIIDLSYIPINQIDNIINGNSIKLTLNLICDACTSDSPMSEEVSKFLIWKYSFMNMIDGLKEECDKHEASHSSNPCHFIPTLRNVINHYHI